MKNQSSNKRRPFVQVPKFALTSPSLSSGDFRVLCYLLSFVGRKYPSYETIVRETGLAKRTVAKSVKTLKALNVIEYVRGSNLKGRSNVYTIRDESFWCLKSPKSKADLGANMHRYLVQTGHSTKNSAQDIRALPDGTPLTIEGDMMPTDYFERIENLRLLLLNPSNADWTSERLARHFPRMVDSSQQAFAALTIERQKPFVAIVLFLEKRVLPPAFEVYLTENQTSLTEAKRIAKVRYWISEYLKTRTPKVA